MTRDKEQKKKKQHEKGNKQGKKDEVPDGIAMRDWMSAKRCACSSPSKESHAFGNDEDEDIRAPAAACNKIEPT